MAAKSSDSTPETETPRPRRTRRKVVESAPVEQQAAAESPAPRDDDFGAGLEVSTERPSRSDEHEPAYEQQEGRDSDGPRGDDSDSGMQTNRRRRRRRRRKPQDGPGGGGDRGGDRGPQQQRRRGGGGGGGGGGRGPGGQHQMRDRGYDRDRGRGRRPRIEGDNGTEITGTIEGVLELHPKGYGFLRDPAKNYAAQDTDAFVSSSLIEKFKLREGIMIRGDVGPGSKGQGPRLRTIETIDKRSVEDYQKIRVFDELTAINPFEQIHLERGPRPITMRVMDLLTPIGKGQRALIVAPPRTGKTMLLQDIAASVSENHPEVTLMVLLIDERPEEVTEMRRNVRGEVIASSMDRDVESHVRISQLILERAKRITEAGGEVFLLLDSITRTARAFNKWVGNTGRTMSGGLDVKALDIPKKMFGTARRFDEGGSLTIVATALIDTGSRMDEVIFQEFKGTGNMELVLSRDLADRRIWPAIDIGLSGTRREEKILPSEVLDGTTMLRRSLVSLSSTEAMEQLVRTLERFPSNAEFLTKIRSVL